MALVVFLRGVNVGGHRTFRSSVLARELSAYDVVNVGAAGTFVVRNPGSRAKFRDELLRKLPFAAEVMICDGRDLLRLETANPFAKLSSREALVRFVSVLARPSDGASLAPTAFPPKGEWFVRVLVADGRFLFGVYRRHMKTIRYLGEMDKRFGAAATTRNWNTILAVIEILKDKRGRAGREL